MNITPAANSTIKVAVNFFAVVAAVWVADIAKTQYNNWQSRKASASAGNGGGAPPASNTGK